MISAAQRISRILGADVLGEHPEEIINISTLAIHQGTSEDLWTAVYAYPTSSSDVS